ncbi:MAG: glycosyltransferase family 2 protein [Pseudomonadota bacterium]
MKSESMPASSTAESSAEKDYTEASFTETLKVSVSMVTFHTEFGLLGKTLDGLHRALVYARSQGLDISLHLLVVDNSTDKRYCEKVRELFVGEQGRRFEQVDFWHPGENIGYGAAHNQALRRAHSDYHLVLNPDVELAQDALYSGLSYMWTHPDVAVVSPRATDGHGQTQYLCKRYPSVLVLTLRAFAPSFVRRRFQDYLHSYEIRDACVSDRAADVPLVSGCCMCVRTDILHRAHGFSDQFFMYFEDFDLSLRLQPLGRLVYLPSMHIVHHGGYSARKGLRHITMFAESGWKFFRRHGWCWI